VNVDLGVKLFAGGRGLEKNSWGANNKFLGYFSKEACEAFFLANLFWVSGNARTRSAEDLDSAR